MSLADERAKRGMAPVADVPGTVVREARLKVLQERLIKIIDDHETELSPSLRELGCGGDCLRCPHPEHPTVEAQVNECLRSVVGGLNLDPELLKEPG